jgi:prophage regulatory protein
MTVVVSSALSAKDANPTESSFTSQSCLIGGDSEVHAHLIEASDRLLRLPAVLKLIGVSRATLYRWCQQGHFIKPCRLSARLVAWRQSEVIHWITTREAVS